MAQSGSDQQLQYTCVVFIRVRLFAYTSHVVVLLDTLLVTTNMRSQSDLNMYVKHEPGLDKF